MPTPTPTPTPTTCADIAAAIRSAEAEWDPSVAAFADRVYTQRVTARGRSTSIGLIEVTLDGRAVHHLSRDVRAITAVLAARGIKLERP